MSQKTGAKRRFDSSTFTASGSLDLPVEPLPPETVSGETMVSRSDAPVIILPIGEVDEAMLQGITAEVGAMYGRRVVVEKSLPVPKYAYNPSREQYHSASILKRVESAMQPEWDAAIGVVDVDLFVPEVPFIFGEADRSTRAAIISLSRLRPEMGAVDSRSELLRKRLASEVIHQMGLIRGLAHCPNNRCVMFMSTTVQETDKKGLQLCANCRKRLGSSDR